MQHIAQFTQPCKETGIIEDFNFIESENSPPSDVDMSVSTQKAAWLMTFVILGSAIFSPIPPKPK
jgi:hypothetical protein